MVLLGIVGLPRAYGSDRRGGVGELLQPPQDVRVDAVDLRDAVRDRVVGPRQLAGSDQPVPRDRHDAHLLPCCCKVLTVAVGGEAEGAATGVPAPARGDSAGQAAGISRSSSASLLIASGS